MAQGMRRLFIIIIAGMAALALGSGAVHLAPALANPTPQSSGSSGGNIAILPPGGGPHLGDIA